MKATARAGVSTAAQIGQREAAQPCTAEDSLGVPTFLFGMERSGTTLLSMMIGAHPQVAVPLATTGMWIGFAKRLDADFNGLATRGDIARLVDAILAHERIALWDAALDQIGRAHV